MLPSYLWSQMFRYRNISQKCYSNTFFFCIYTAHVQSLATRFRVGTNSRGHDKSGATRGIASHRSLKATRVNLKCRIYSGSAKSLICGLSHTHRLWWRTLICCLRLWFSIVKATAVDVMRTVPTHNWFWVSIFLPAVLWDEISLDWRSSSPKYPSMETFTKCNCAILKCKKYQFCEQLEWKPSYWSVIYTTYQVLKNRATDAAVKLTQDNKINMLPSYIYIFLILCTQININPCVHLNQQQNLKLIFYHVIQQIAASSFACSIARGISPCPNSLMWTDSWYASSSWLWG